MKVNENTFCEFASGFDLHPTADASSPKVFLFLGEEMSEQRPEYVTDALIMSGTIVKSDGAYERHRRIVELRNSAERTFLELGQELYWFEENKQYKEMGHETFESYLADPDVDIHRRTAFMLKGIYQDFILGLKVQPVALLPCGHAKLDIIRPFINQENAGEWISKAASLSRSDLKIEILQCFPPPPAPPLPTGKFNVIYADPPWQYDNSGFDEAAENQYHTMPVDEICRIPVGDLFTDSSVLLLWATNPLLPEAMQVLNAWGFTYKTNMAWIKDRGRGKGWWLRSKHELMLIGTRTNTQQPTERPDSCFQADRGAVHSRKPEFVYSLIEAMFPGPYIELFARNTRKGWTSWGNEL